MSDPVEASTVVTTSAVKRLVDTDRSRESAGNHRRLRVAMLLNWFYYYTASLAEALSPSADVLLVATDNGRELGVEGDASAAKRDLLCDRVQLQLVHGRQRDFVTAVSTLGCYRALRDFRPDVVHVQAHTDWRLWLLQRLAGRVPALMTMHDVSPHSGWQPDRNRLQFWVHCDSLRHTDAFIVHGSNLASELGEKPWWRGQPVFVIPHGVLAHPHDARPLPERPTVLFFGRLEYYKGLDLFVEAVERAAEKIPGLRAIIAGAGSEAARCRALVRRPGVFEWREGFVPDSALPDLFGESSLVVLPYRDASQSGVVPLAFSNGRPVVVTRVGALAEAVDDEVDGIVVEAPSAAAIAKAIVKVLAEPGLLERLAANALVTATEGRLSMSQVSKAHLDAYRAIIGAHRSLTPRL